MDSEISMRTSVAEPKGLGIIIPSIPAKPLAQAKLKRGGFFITLKNHPDIPLNLASPIWK
jgi:hypothetical protein